MTARVRRYLIQTFFLRKTTKIYLFRRSIEHGHSHLLVLQPTNLKNIKFSNIQFSSPFFNIKFSKLKNIKVSKIKKYQTLHQTDFPRRIM